VTQQRDRAALRDGATRAANAANLHLFDSVTGAGTG
jgi:hypothetical protein